VHDPNQPMHGKAAALREAAAKLDDALAAAFDRDEGSRVITPSVSMAAASTCAGITRSGEVK